MHDQADELRKWVRQRAAAERPSREGPAFVVVASGQRGVGATTIATNLAVALARSAVGTALVDLDPRGAGPSALLDLPRGPSLSDVLANRATLAEAVVARQERFHILRGAATLERLSDFPAAAMDRLADGLLQLEADVILVDAGSAPVELVERLWRRASDFLLVTTGDARAVLESYGVVKALSRKMATDVGMTRETAASEGRGAKGATATDAAAASITAPPAVRVQTIVNMVEAPEAATDVHARIAQAGQRFLGIEITAAGQLPLDPRVKAAGRSRTSVLQFAPDAPATAALRQMAVDLARRLAPHALRRSVVAA